MTTASPSRAHAILLVNVIAVMALCVWPTPHATMLESAVLDAGHTPVFALFTVVTWWCLRALRPWSARRALVGAMGATLAMGASTEFVQYFLDRNADLRDLGHDLVGAAVAALVLVALGRVGWTRTANVGTLGRATALAGVVGLLVLAVLPLSRVLERYRARDAAFPVLLDFERPDERSFLHTRDARLWRAPAPRAWRQDPAQHVGVVDYGSGDWPAVILSEPVGDWSGYDALEFEVIQPAACPTTLYLRIDDARATERFEDRFNTAVVIGPGSNHVRIELAAVRSGPRDRELDLTRVRGLSFFVRGAPITQRLYLDRVRLTSSRHVEARRSPSRAS